MNAPDEPDPVAGDVAEATPADGGGGASPAAPQSRQWRILAWPGWIPHPPWNSRRGVLLRFLLIAGFGAVAAFGLLYTAHYTETASFCGRCHTMGPELKAHDLSPHRQLACAECHVEPGVRGFIKAKANGTKQLVQVMTGTFPKPIPPPDHSQLPSVRDTCLRCHSVRDITRDGGPVKLVLRPRYQADEKNTRELVALVLRPAGLGTASGAKGVHWHIQETVRYSSTDPAAQKIDLVEITRPDGAVNQFVAAAEVNVSTDAAADVARVRAASRPRVMDCIDCHNRVGHAVPSTEQAVDDAIAAGRISAALPFVKRDAVTLLNGDYPTLAAADAAMDRLATGYQGRYPLVSRRMSAQIAAAVAELKRIYRQLATPDMKVQARTYPDNLGHQRSPGCFRCHDGAHYQVVAGKLTDKVIPSSCATCHTFPQVGGNVPSISLAGQPASHADKLYVFNHAKLTSDVDPSTTSCAACHTRAYCVNCHSTNVAKVNHDEMLYNHAASIRRAGGQSCAYCHQAVYCARCHATDPVLSTPPGGG